MSNSETLKQFKYIFNKTKAYWSESTQSYIIPQTYKKYLRTDIKTIFESRGIKDPYLLEREIVALVFPFKVCEYILDHIDWDNYMTDPLFLLTFPQPEMLKPFEIRLLKVVLESGASKE